MIMACPATVRVGVPCNGLSHTSGQLGMRGEDATSARKDARRVSLLEKGSFFTETFIIGNPKFWLVIKNVGSEYSLALACHNIDQNYQ